MFETNRFACCCAILLVATVAAVCTGCGSSSSQNISQAQAQAVSHEVVIAAEAALTAAVGTPAARAEHPSLGSLLAHARPAAQSSSGCTPTSSGETCNFPVSYTGSCPGGGTIAVAGDFNFTLDNSGNGTDSATLTVTPTNCSVSNLTLNGNPDITLATQLSFQSDAPVFPITATEGGGITYGPNPSGSCSLNVTLTINSESSCSVTGTVCGQSVTGTC